MMVTNLRLNYTHCDCKSKGHHCAKERIWMMRHNTILFGYLPSLSMKNSWINGLKTPKS